jgi:hypothetical protein
VDGFIDAPPRSGVAPSERATVAKPDRRRCLVARWLDDDPRRSLVLCRHRVEILNDDIAEPARSHADRDDLVGLQCVDVDLHHRFIADHEHTVGAELRHLSANVFDRSRRVLHEELHVVRAGPRRDLARDHMRGRGLRARLSGSKTGTPTFERGECAIQQVPEPLRAGIDDAR